MCRFKAVQYRGSLPTSNSSTAVFPYIWRWPWCWNGSKTAEAHGGDSQVPMGRREWGEGARWRAFPFHCAGEAARAASGPWRINTLWRLLATPAFNKWECPTAAGVYSPLQNNPCYNVIKAVMGPRWGVKKKTTTTHFDVVIVIIRTQLDCGKCVTL